MRKTIARAVTAEGVALHAGTPVRAELLPAPRDTGIVFRRDDQGVEIPARHDRVVETRLGTTIAGGGATIAVIEHLMAAVFAAGIDDLVIALDGPEPPLLDGDAISWLDVIDSAGVRDQEGERPAIKVMTRVEVEHGNASAALSPADALAFDFAIQFDSAAIGAQQLSWTFSPAAFRRDIAPARTFGFVQELAGLRAAGLANGASLENTLSIEGDGLRNPGLQRFADEFVRHKILDAIGDLALAGAPLIGRFEGRRSGHALNNALLRALFADPANYEMTR
ncbi:MAG TPA: UDP-3-O-acyl-N-acetylglucosamine deacetylase [Rhizomicrobium sp.]|jgi:UDP-3-O-[3-hydroxymyristoyl] N-acetylglucosamine deacetylase|nr:UDP-3-O-acyl-N-acetylglucosamine deacetylase [Rhizomicrobium sp.]